MRRSNGSLFIVIKFRTNTFRRVRAAIYIYIYIYIYTYTHGTWYFVEQRLEALDCGKPLDYAQFDVLHIVNVFRYFAGWCDKITGTTIPVGKSITTQPHVQVHRTYASVKGQFIYSW